MERKLGAAHGGAVKKVEVSTDKKRQRYMALREHLSVRMKQGKASHFNGMTEMARKLENIRAEERRNAELARQREEGWRGLALGETAMAEPEVVAEIQSAGLRSLMCVDVLLVDPCSGFHSGSRA